jgi:hypothetical protein
MYRIRFVKVNLESKETTTGEIDVRKAYGKLCPYGALDRVGVEFHSKLDAEEFAKQYEALYSNPERYRVTTEVFESNKLEDDMLESIDYVKVVKMRAEMLDSYMMAIVKCGGSPKSFIADIETMTVKEMIDALAQNGVRFTNK